MMPSIGAANTLKNLELVDYLKRKDHSDMPMAKKLLVAFMLGKGLSQKAIAIDTGISLGYVSKINVLLKGVI